MPSAGCLVVLSAFSTLTTKPFCMKHFLPAVWCVLLFLQSCGLREREEALKQKETTLSQKEQELLLREQSLALREEELLRQRKAADSLRLRDSTALLDTAATVNPALAGLWDVQMTCTETSCAGSAVGDTKTEVWEISYQQNDVIAKATAAGKLVRVYSGRLRGATLELTEAQQSKASPDAKFSVRLQLTDEAKMHGQREIERLTEKCRIVYLLALSKK